MARQSRPRRPRGKSLDVHVVSHTHWDREWYRTASVFRQRLVQIVDDVLENTRRDRDLRFLLDGQAVVLEDYLSVRPEKTEQVAGLLARGILEAGPWYVLADELIPSGESLVRNLLMGRKVLGALGAKPPAVLYCPDSFGHPAALPTLASGFGCNLVILWRGFGGASHPSTNLFKWRAPDGSQVLTYHLARGGYDVGVDLPRELQQAAQRWAGIRAALGERDKIGVVLLPNGADHHALQRERSTAISLLARVASPDRVTGSSLRRFSADLVARASGRRLPLVEGELRDSYGYTWTLQGTFATRTNLKRLLASATRQLEREAEPWSALAAARKGISRRHLVNAAWKPLLQSIPHDTICGCSIDEVAAEASFRLRDAEEQARHIGLDSIEALAGYDRTAVRDEASEPHGDAVVLLNPAARRRGGVAEVRYLRKVTDIRVGPGSAVQPEEMPLTEEFPPRLVGELNNSAPRLPMQALSVERRYDLIESPQHYPDQDLVEEGRLLIFAPEVSGYGLQPLYTAWKASPVATVPNPVRVAGDSITNGLVAAGVDREGRVWLESPPLARRVWLSLEDQTDAGDLYTPAPRGDAIIADTARLHAIQVKGELRSAMEMNFEFSTSVENDGDILIVTDDPEAGDGSDFQASSGREKSGVQLLVTLDANSEVVNLLLTGVNRHKNHRLRLLISGDIDGATVAADASFGPVFRNRSPKSPDQSVMEHRVPTDPLQRHLTILNSTGAMTVFSAGTPEYEWRADRILALTLVRSVGQLSRHDLPDRPGNAGWPVAVPAAQQIGPFTAQLAWMAHAASQWDQIADRVQRASDDFLHPLRGITLRSAPAVPEPLLGVELHGDGLALSAIKESEDGRYLVLRCVNTTSKAVRGSWRLGHKVKSAKLARLDETPIKAVKLASGSRIPFRAPPFGVVTILAR